MGLINYTQLEDGFTASANLWNERFGQIIDVLNGGVDAENLSLLSVGTEHLQTGSVTSEKLGFTQTTDDNGWLITDLGLVKLATKHRTFTIPQRAQGAGGYVTLDTGMNLNPVGFDENAPYNVMHSPYMSGITYSVGPWILYPKDATGSGKLKPGSGASAFRNSGGTSTAGEPGAIDTWVIF